MQIKIYIKYRIEYNKKQNVCSVCLINGIFIKEKNAKGEPYGWHINRYSFVEDWAPQVWLAETDDLTKEEAREYILDTVMEISTDLNRDRLDKVLFGSLQ